MSRLLSALAPDEGYTLSPLPGVRWLRSNRPLGVTPVLYEPGFVIVCQGRKRGWLGDQAFVYDEQQVLAVAVPVPFTMQTEASPERPLLAIYVQLDFVMAAELATQIASHPRHDVARDIGRDIGRDIERDIERASRRGTRREARAEVRNEIRNRDAASPRSLVSTPLDDALADAVVRLLQSMHDPLQAQVLGPLILREIYFRVLAGEQGDTLRSALSAPGRFGQVGKAIQRIHRDYATALTVPALAEASALGLAAFHHHFREVTQTSPMQYLKSIRLHQARLLMLRQGITAASAAHAVGYESPSQFSREFKRLFGLSPMAEVERLKSSFSYPERPPSGYVSSH
ncbi:AraC family transcriptional regulator [Roseateles terrae]|nr:AraC family transcriptional regulator [Roseateles terrae]OWQ89545.1 AraC family transcriptional regulator [Roseateles terrae]